MFNRPFSISCHMQLVFIHHHLPTPLGETGYIDCHILQFGTVHRQLYMVVHTFYKSSEVFCEQWSSCSV